MRHASLLSRLANLATKKRIQLVVSVFVIAGVGSLFLVATHAATKAPSIEAETGTASRSVAVGTDGSASGGHYVMFGATQDPGVSCPNNQIGFPPDCVTDGGGTVTTKSGVVTHGAITTTVDTIGWLLTCQPSHELPDDPIAFPGQPGAAHLHDFWGNASTNGNSSVTSQEDHRNIVPAESWNGATVVPGTSCNLAQFDPGTNGDTASYWAPVLYANGQKIQPGTKAQLYYRAKPTFGTGFKTIPQDARIIVGNKAATSISTNPALADSRLYWECQGDTSIHYQVPPNSCADLLANIVFPSCYDGGPMDHTGPSHTDNQHFAYAVNGSCPNGFAIKIPQLSEKFKYTVPSTGMQLELSANQSSSMPGMTSGLMPTYTMHADFWNTWNPAALQYLVDKCINAQESCGTNPQVPIQ